MLYTKDLFFKQFVAGFAFLPQLGIRRIDVFQEIDEPGSGQKDCGCGIILIFLVDLEILKNNEGKVGNGIALGAQ